MQIVKYRRIFFTGSLILVGIALYSLFSFSLNLGSDFTGGTIMEIEYVGARPNVADIKTALASTKLESLSVVPMGEKGLIVKAKVISDAEKDTVNKALSLGGKAQFTEKRFSQVGPSLGKELSRKGMIAIVLVVLLIIIFIAFAFRQVSKHHMASWKYGVAAIIALVHDITISAGAMALLGHFYGAEADALFLTALLTILGLSVNDTIVVFDRIRENLNRHESNDFAEVAGISINETYIRSINTTLTIIITLICLLIFGPESTRYFSAVLLVGMTVGTYSSIFVASNLLVEWETWQRRRLAVKVKK
ncbi:MAG: protein translocase subunit SecF [Candidatus Paceibacterota bacterium]|jgi:preprotein translocase subunit SecF